MELLAEDLGVGEDEVVKTVMRHVFECLNDLHAAGVVHRDVKPANLVFSEKQRRFKLIDLGAAADLRTGTNYVPTETMLDPVYCAPEEYVLPTETTDLAKQGVVAQIMSPIVWSQHRPECFDSYSAGVVLLQLALPFLRQGSSLKNWKQTMIRLNHDVKAWREKANLSSRQTQILDANGGMGWELVEGLLQPREIEGDGQGGVRFVGAAGKAPRLTPTEALRHPFLKKSKVYAKKKGGVSGSGSGSRSVELEGAVSAASSLKAKKSGFNWFKNRMFDLEAKIARQAEDAETQTTIVKRLEEDVKSGKASEKELEVARSRLDAMKGTLSSSMAEMGSMFENARSFFSSSGGSGGYSVRAAAEGNKENDGAAREDPEDTSDLSAADRIDSANSSVDVDSSSYPSTSSNDEVKFFAEAAGNAIYSGLKLTGKALIGLADLASSAEESLSAAQEKRAAIRKEQAILEELLGRMDLTSNAEWADVSTQVRTILDDSILSEAQMKRTFNSYIGGIAREERLRIRQAKIDFGTLLSDARLRSSTNYDGFVAQFGRDPRFVALDDNEARIALFEAHMESVRKREEQLKLASKVLDVSDDEIVQEQTDDADKKATSADTLERLKDEQNRMRLEYAEMEKKLRNMESLLKTSSLLDVSREAGGVTYTFADSPPSAKASKKKNSSSRKK